MPFTVAIASRTNIPFDTSGLTITPSEAWTAQALGGFDSASLNVSGTKDAIRRLAGWLLFRVQIIDDRGVVCWEGYVDSLDMRLGGSTVTMSTEWLYNSVRVLYSYSSPDGGSESAMTDWLTDADSINEFGRKELLHSAGGEVSKESAESLRANVLAAQKKPIPSPRASSSDVGGTLYCKGKYHTLEWRYYEDATGYLAHEDSNGRALLGWALSGANRFGFVGEGQNRILDFTGGLADLQDDDEIRISGSASNNLSVKVTSATSGDTTTYTASTISFDPTNDIRDSANGFSNIRTYEGILVSGTPNNNGYYLTGDVVTPSHIETTTSFGADPIQSDSAGNPFTVAQAHNVQVGTALTHEIPSASVVTVQALATVVAQSFQIPDGPWDVGEIAIQIGKHGTPSDTISVVLYANSGSSPGAALTSGTILAADIPYTPGWVTVKLSAPYTLANATTYWIAVNRTGATSATNYYEVAIDNEAGYASGALKYYNGSAWVSPAVASDMPFQVWGVIDSTAKITQIVAACASSVVLGTSIVTTSGVMTRRKRDGKTDAWTEIEDLLKQGESSLNRRLQARVDSAGMLVVDAEPLTGMLDLIWGDDATLRYPDGTKVAPGYLPAGRWIQLESLTGGDWTAGGAGFVCETASYDPQSGAWDLQAKGLPDPFDLGIQQG